MAKLRRYIQLARSLPPSEILRKGKVKFGRTITYNWRAAQAQLFGTDISDSRLRAALIPPLQDSNALLAFLRAGERPCFFIDARQREAVLAAFRRHCPMADALTIVAANQACNHIFDLLGSGPTHLGDEIDWHVDFKTGHHYDPRQYYANIYPANYPGGHDIKVPWELSRCQHFAWLGQAYWYTGDEKYTCEFVAQVTDWIEANPPKFGVNWACTMDVAIRVANWLWGYHFFKDSPALTDEFLLSLNKSLLAHGRHIINNLERSDELTANHYLSDIVGLVYLGLMCPQFAEAQRWREFGLHELRREMFKQVYADGVDFEASINYHRLATELFLSPILLCRLHGVTVPADVMARLEKMLEFVMHYTKPDGTVPLFGDCDNGRLHRLKVWVEPEREWIDHRYLLAIGAVLFERDDFGQAAGDQWEEAFWMWGDRAIAFKEQLDSKMLPPLQLGSRAFLDGGLYIMRGEDNYMIVDAGSNGQNGVGGHAHNDTLSFEYYAGGQSWVIDPGAYVYTADFDARNLFRSSRYHNVLTIDDQEINRFDKSLLFSLSNDAQPSIHVRDSSAERDLLIASHSGYERLKPPAFVRRTFWLDKQAGRLLVYDEAESIGRHKFAAHFHFTTSQIEIEGKIARIAPPASEWQLAVWVSPSVGDASLTTSAGWISASYGSRTPASVLTVSGEFSDRLAVGCLLVPYRCSERLLPEELSVMGQQIVAKCCL